MIRLEQMRLDARLTPEELAEHAGVSARTIRRLEDGTAVRDATLWKLADYFRCQPSELVLPVAKAAA